MAGANSVQVSGAGTIPVTITSPVRDMYSGSKRLVNTPDVYVVPEPDTWTLLALAIAGTVRLSGESRYYAKKIDSEGPTV